MDLGLAEVVAEAAVQVEGVGEMSAGLLVVAEFGARECQESAGEGLPGGVTEAGSGGQRRALGGAASW